MTIAANTKYEGAIKGGGNMISKEKIDAFKQYLQDEFPGWEIDDAEDFERMSRKFRILNESMIHIVYVQRRFWVDYDDTKKALQSMGLGKVMKENEDRYVLVGTSGLTLLQPYA
jgi:hypothetical protein